MDILAEASKAAKSFGAFTAVSGVDQNCPALRLPSLSRDATAGRLRPPDARPLHRPYRRGELELHGRGVPHHQRPDTRGHLRAEERASRGASARRAAPGCVRRGALPPARAADTRRAHLGVGPPGSARLWEEIRQTVSRHAGALVTTHNMEEAEQCDRLIVMADGKVVATGTAAGIIGDREAVEIHCDDAGRLCRPRRERLRRAGAGEGAAAAGTATAAADLLSRAGIDATIETVPANLEEAFVAIIGNPEAG